MYVEGYTKVRVWVPDRYPDQGLPPGIGGGPIFPPGLPDYPDQGLPGYPDQGLPGEPPGIGGGPVLPGWPERPGQGLPPVGRPPRPVYPVVEDPEDLGGHPELPDLNMTRRITITDGSDQFTGYVLDPEPPQVEEGYEPRYPERGLPGTWVAVLYGAMLAWAWVRTPGERPELPEYPEREPKRV
jgi:hypothetical protein